MRRAGFTLIELLVVIAIISLLSSIVLASLSESREKAKIAKAQAQLIEVRNAIALLEADTGKWPGGCPSGYVDNKELFIQGAQMGIMFLPFDDPFNVLDGSCGWTDQDRSNWKGPYI